MHYYVEIPIQDDAADMQQRRVKKAAEGSSAHIMPLQRKTSLQNRQNSLGMQERDCLSQKGVTDTSNMKP